MPAAYGVCSSAITRAASENQRGVHRRRVSKAQSGGENKANIKAMAA